MKKDKKIVCLGGGIGTSRLIKGLKEYSTDISVVISMADDGGSTGRLRRIYNIPPPGDMVSCMAALSDDSQIADLLTYRFPGDRYGADSDLPGHKLGNLIMVAMRDNTKDFGKAIKFFQKTFNIKGTFLPATKNAVTISATTIEGHEVKTEQKIDLGEYSGRKIIEKLKLEPQDPEVFPGVLEAMQNADLIVAGPGDLYTTVLPTLIVPDIKTQLLESKKSKIFIVNIANKFEETNNYSVLDFITAIEKHLGVFPFQKIIVNKNTNTPIPYKWKKQYAYISCSKDVRYKDIDFIFEDVVDDSLPLYHNSNKLAKAIIEHI